MWASYIHKVIELYIFFLNNQVIKHILSSSDIYWGRQINIIYLFIFSSPQRTPLVSFSLNSCYCLNSSWIFAKWKSVLLYSFVHWHQSLLVLVRGHKKDSMYIKKKNRISSKRPSWISIKNILLIISGALKTTIATNCVTVSRWNTITFRIYNQIDGSDSSVFLYALCATGLFERSLCS